MTLPGSPPQAVWVGKDHVDVTASTWLGYLTSTSDHAIVDHNTSRLRIADTQTNGTLRVTECTHQLLTTTTTTTGAAADTDSSAWLLPDVSDAFKSHHDLWVDPRKAACLLTALRKPMR